VCFIYIKCLEVWKTVQPGTKNLAKAEIQWVAKQPESTIFPQPGTKNLAKAEIQWVAKQPESTILPQPGTKNMAKAEIQWVAKQPAGTRQQIIKPGIHKQNSCISIQDQAWD